MGHTFLKVKAWSVITHKETVHIAGAVHKTHTTAGMKYHHRIERQVGGAVIGDDLHLCAAKGRVMGGQHGVDPPGVLCLVRPEMADGPQLVPQAVEIVALVQPDIQPPSAAKYQFLVCVHYIF